MKLLKHILVLAIIAPFLSFGQDLSTPLMKTKVDVVYLSSDLLEGRATASIGEQLASEYIISRFKGLGLRPAAPDGTWIYPFMYREKAHPHDTSNSGPVKTGHNVLGKIDNGSATTVIVGAHYDHLGMGGPGSGSLAANEIAIHNGADDNASGVAAMLAIAEKLKNNPAAKNNNYLFIAFSGEELGLYGSNAYSKDPAFDMTSINYMINLDMVGRLGTSDKTIAVSGVGTSSAWKPMLENNAVLRGIKISATESGQGPSDHTSFTLEAFLYYICSQANIKIITNQAMMHPSSIMKVSSRWQTWSQISLNLKMPAQSWTLSRPKTNLVVDLPVSKSPWASCPITSTRMAVSAWMV